MKAGFNASEISSSSLPAALASHREATPALATGGVGHKSLRTPALPYESARHN